MAGPWEKYASAAQPVMESGPWAKYQQPTESLSWSDVPGKALMNAPESAGKLAGGIWDAITHPVQTVSTIADLGAGALRHGAQKVLPKAAVDFMDTFGAPENIQRIDATEKAVLGHLSERYGTQEGIKKALAEDPVGVMADLSAVLGGGGTIAARVPGLARAGQAAQTAGRMVDPLANAVKAAGAAGRVGTELLGVTTGTGARPIQEAFKAGQAGNSTFTEHMRGTGDAREIVDKAERAVGAMARERSDAYRTGMDATKAGAAWQSLDMTPAWDAYSKALAENTYHGLVTDDKAAAALKAVGDKLQQFRDLGQAGTSLEGMDTLKKTIGVIRESTEQGTNARRVVDGVYNAVKQAIVDQAPEYAKVMEGYGKASDELGELRRTMSINERATTDTSLRKLTSAMRNNVNTNFGERERLLDVMAKREPDLPAAIAGQSMNTWAPRGLARLGIHNALTAGAAYMNPLALATLPLQSPRLVGEAAYAAGRATNALARGASAAKITPEVMQNALLSAYAANALGGQR